MDDKFQKAIAAYEGQKFHEAYKLFLDISEENPKAVLNLARMSMRGEGCERNDNDARKWLQKAADVDNIQALYTLGVIYEQGIDKVPDNETALSYYVRAADQGDTQSQLKSGLLYMQNNETLKAMQYLITAAHNGNEQAQSLITYVSNASTSQESNSVFRSMNPQQQKDVIQKMIDTKIRPTLEADSGGITLVNYVASDVPQIWLNYLGACSGCHLSSTSTADMLLDHFETLIDKNVILYLM
jgi:uncharacterized protein